MKTEKKCSDGFLIEEKAFFFFFFYLNLIDKWIRQFKNQQMSDLIF